MIIKKFLRMMLAATVLGFSVGCSSGPDRGEPTEVFQAFFEALAADDIKRATKFVAPQEKESFLSDWSSATGAEARVFFAEQPPFPPDPAFEATRRGDTAVVTVRNWGKFKGFADMVLIDGQWFVTDN